jgi:hypothetical protein
MHGVSSCPELVPPDLAPDEVEEGDKSYDLHEVRKAMEDQDSKNEAAVELYLAAVEIHPDLIGKGTRLQKAMISFEQAFGIE